MLQCWSCWMNTGLLHFILRPLERPEPETQDGGIEDRPSAVNCSTTAVMPIKCRSAVETKLLMSFNQRSPNTPVKLLRPLHSLCQSFGTQLVWRTSSVQNQETSRSRSSFPLLTSRGMRIQTCVAAGTERSKYKQSSEDYPAAPRSKGAEPAWRPAC